MSLMRKLVLWGIDKMSRKKKWDGEFANVFMADYQFDGGHRVLVVLSDGNKLIIEFTPSQWAAVNASYERHGKAEEAA